MERNKFIEKIFNSKIDLLASEPESGRFQSRQNSGVSRKNVNGTQSEKFCLGGTLGKFLSSSL